MKKIMILFLLVVTSNVFAGYDCEGGGYKVIVTDKREMTITGNGIDLDIEGISYRQLFNEEYYANVAQGGINSIKLSVKSNKTGILVIEKRFSTEKVEDMKCTKN